MGSGSEQFWSQDGMAARTYDLHQGYQNLQTQQQATTQADQQANAQVKGSWIMGPFGPVLRFLDESKAKAQYNDKLPAEVKSLRQGLAIRSAPGFAMPNYESYSHPQLHQMVTTGVDPGTVGSVGDTWIDMGDDLTQFQSHIASALSSSETTWTGTAGENARKSVADLGNKGASAGQAAQLAGVVTHQQSQALATAKNNMPAPSNPAFSPQAAVQQLQTITDPAAYAKQAATDQQQAAAQKQAQQQAASVVREYDTTMAQTSASMPAFAPAPPVVHKPGGPTPPAAPKPNPPGSTPGGIGTTPRFGTRQTSPTGPSNVNQGTGSTGPAGTPGQYNPPNTQVGNTNTGVPQTTNTSGYVPPESLPNQGSNGPGGVNGPGGFNAPSGFGGGPGGGTGGAGAGAFGAPVGGAGGAGGGLGAGGSRGGLGSGSGGGGQGSTGGAGNRSGVGATAAEEAALGRGATGARGSSGGMGAGGLGAGRGKGGGEDEEHRRPSWLIEADEGIFENEQKVVPPVIGE